jgi:hypothetical protein
MIKLLKISLISLTFITANLLLSKSLIAENSLAENSASNNHFYFKPALSIEYVGSDLSNGANKNFKTNNFGKQISGFENIAIGGNLRIHKFLGFNLNWFQSEFSNDTLENYSISNKARFKFQQYNLTALSYFEANDFIEFFAEAGLSNIRSELKFSETNSNSNKFRDSQNSLLYGFGIQGKFGKENRNLIRLSFHRQNQQLKFLNVDYASVRIGYAITF